MAQNGCREIADTQSKLKELKAKCEDLLGADPSQTQSDASLCRFLRAFPTVDSAYNALVKCIKWRQEYGVESLTDSHHAIQKEKATGTAVLLRHRDIQGRPIIYIAVRKHKVKERDIDEFTRFIVYMLESACKMCHEDIIDNLCIVFDMKDFSMANMDYQFVKNLIWLLSKYYPERLGVCLVINAPMVFYGCWTVIRPWLNDVTASKVTFVNGMQQLCDYLHPDMLPDDNE